MFSSLSSANFSLKSPLRYRLACDPSLVRDVLQIFVRTVFASIRRRAGIPASNRRARCGAVTFIQRFSDALNLDPYFHTLALDGIYVEGRGGKLVFQRIPPPGDAEVAHVADRVHRGVLRLFELDVLACTRCGARMRVLAAIDSPDAIQKILDWLGLPTRAPPIAPAIPGDALAF